MEETYTPRPLLMLGLLALMVAAMVAWADLQPAAPPAPWAAPVPTLMPTPALAVPPPPLPLPTAPPAVYVERVEAGGQVTVNQTNIDVDVCILARCP